MIKAIHISILSDTFCFYAKKVSFYPFTETPVGKINTFISFSQNFCE